MRTVTYECDGGSIAIGSVGVRVQIPNCYGDGTHYLYIYDCGEQVPDGAIFRGAVRGKRIKVFKYDCYTDEECKNEENIIAKLSGRFGIFALPNSGDMILQRWD